MISAHIVGMYALVLVVGRFVDRQLGRRPGADRRPADRGGVRWPDRLGAQRRRVVLCLFGLGIGWNVAFVAAAAELADIALPVRARQAARVHRSASRASPAPALALAGGVIYSQMGAIALGVGAMAIAAVPGRLVHGDGGAPAASGVRQFTTTSNSMPWASGRSVE